MSTPVGSSQWMYSSGAGSFYPYLIDQSLRFNDGDSPRLSLDPIGSPTLTTKCTISFWVKRGQLTTTQYVFTGEQSNLYYDVIYISNADKLAIVGQENASSYGYQTSALFRDVGAWYHVVLECDSTQATGTDRYKLYVNGVQQTLTSIYGVHPLNHAWYWNKSGNSQNIGRSENYANSFDGYIAEFNFIDGTALDATSFGETINDIWVPKAYSGSYGTNGFYLSYADSSAIGDDLSGNTNDFTATNLAASDVMSGESPTNNWCTNNGAMRANITHSEGNLKMVGVGGNFDNMAGTFLFDVEDTDGWYWEGYVNSGGVEVRFGISKPQNIYFNQSDPTFNFAHSSDGIAYKGSGSISTGGIDSSYGDSFTTGDVIGIAVKAGALYFYKNGSIQNSGTAAATGLTGQYVPAVSINSTLSLSTNYGQDSTFAGAVTAGGNTDANGYGDFKYSVPSGYKALCSANLPEVTIGPNSAEQADDYFNTVLYTGNGSTQSITVGLQPDWVWIKNRTNASTAHSLFNTIMGPELRLSSSATTGEQTKTGTVTSFDANGFTTGNNDITNKASSNFVSWNWKAGGTAVSNTDGSITSQVSAAPDAGFSIVSWVSTTSTSDTVGHGLNAAPELIITKNRDITQDWWTYTTAVDGTYDGLRLNLTNASFDASSIAAPTSSVFSNVNTGGAYNNVAYCFHSSDVCKVGSYVGNGSADGTYVALNFSPAWVMIKNTTTGGTNWIIFDDKRSVYNVTNDALLASGANAEFVNNSSFAIDILSNGFKARSSYGDINQSGNTFIYLAFGSSFKYANAR
jgi:hypothetical protein